MLGDWVVGALLVVLGFVLATLYQVWRDYAEGKAQRKRILEYVRLETERNGKVARHLITQINSIGPTRGYVILPDMVDDAWRVATSAWRVTRLETETAVALAEIGQNSRVVNAAVAAYMQYGVTQGAMGNYQEVLGKLAALIVSAAHDYLKSVDQLKLPSG